MKYSELKEGMVVAVDDGFTCIRPGQHTVRAYHNEFFLDCDAGYHFLEAQCDKEGNLIGIDYTNGEGPYRSGYYH